jgi:hypothetical protein
MPAYVEKYRARMARIGLNGPSMAALYSQAIRITVTKVY